MDTPTCPTIDPRSALDTAAIAERLRCSTRFARTIARRLPHLVIAKRLLVAPESIDAYIASLQRPGNPNG